MPPPPMPLLLSVGIAPPAHPSKADTGGIGAGTQWFDLALRPEGTQAHISGTEVLTMRRYVYLLYTVGHLPGAVWDTDM